jgi:energy-converting hydrogenase Eha subunit A
MKPTFNDKLLAYLVLFSGLAISGVAEYYSIMGLIAIYPAALIPIIVMGIVLGLGKISGTVWLKQNWEWSPFFLKAYVLPAIIVLMLITSLGVFGFLSKAHSDQSLVSGDVQAKIAIYDEKIRTAKDNIETNRKQLKQMDEAVDQIMGRSSDEKGADKANSVRKSQQRDRQSLAKDIEANQKIIAQLNNEAAPIRAEVRKVEAEVGPIKYIAHLLYGENPDANILEKAVIWVTVLIVIVLDPLAVVLLLASQYSFQRFHAVEEENEHTPDPYVADVGEKPTEDEFEFLSNYDDLLTKEEKSAEGDSPTGPVVDVVSPDTTVTNYSEVVSTPEEEEAFKTIEKMSAPAPVVQEPIVAPVPISTISQSRAVRTKVFPRPSITVPLPETYVQNEEQAESNLWSSSTTAITQEEYLNKAQEAQAPADDKLHLHRREQDQIIMIADAVQNGRMSIEDIPADIKDQVLAKL